MVRFVPYAFLYKVKNLTEIFHVSVQASSRWEGGTLCPSTFWPTLQKLQWPTCWWRSTTWSRYASSYKGQASFLKGFVSRSVFIRCCEEQCLHVYTADNITAFNPYTVSDAWSRGWLTSLPLIAVQEFIISNKFKSSNAETLKLQLNNPVGIYLRSASIRERPDVPGAPSSPEWAKQDLDGQIKHR